MKATNRGDRRAGRRAVVLAAVLCLVPAAGVTHAQQATMSVGVVVEDVCSLNVTRDIDFGSMRPGTSSAVTGEFQIDCPPGIALQIAINGGQHPNSAGARRVESDGEFARYALWQGGPFVQDWGTGSLTGLEPAAFGSPLPLTTSGGVEAITVHATMSVPASSDLRGAASDTVTIALFF